MKLFTLASLTTLILLIAKVTGLLSVGWFAVFLPVVVSLGIGLLVAILIVSVAKLRS